MSTDTYIPKSKTLTSYRRMILRKYNAKPSDVSIHDFCYRYKIPPGELRFWQQLAGQELQTKLGDMAREEAGIQEEDSYSFEKFHQECAKVIEVTCGGRPVEKQERRSADKRRRYELLRYELLQIIAGLPESSSSELLLTYLYESVELW